LAIVVPWTIRNYLVFDALVPVSTNSGLNLLLGNSENTGPNDGVNVDLSHYAQVARGLSEVERDKYYRDRALEWMGQHPSEAIRLYAAKVLNYFHFSNKLHVKSEQSWIRSAVMAVSYYPLLLIALVRLGAALRVPLSRIESALYTLYFGNALLSAVFFTRIRFRVPFDFVLVMIAAIALAKCARALRRTDKSPSAEEAPPAQLPSTWPQQPAAQGE
jgi:hypothetical protein